METAQRQASVDAQQVDHHQLRGELATHEIEIVGYDGLGREDIDFLRAHFHDFIFPLITPQSIDPAHPFPFISNLSLNLLVHVRFPDQEGRSSLARIKVPTGENLPRFIKLPGRNHFVPVEEVLPSKLDMLRPEMQVMSVYICRVTRNSNTERNEDHADDLLSMIESELRDRRFAPIVRLQIQGDMDETSRGMLAAELGLDEREDVFNAGGDMLAMRDLFQLVALDFPELHDEPFQPIDHPGLTKGTNIFHVIRERGPFLLQHPYESFGTSVERFLKEAALDPKVRAIKMTLYRTSSDTKVVDYLVSAARNGKKVAVVGQVNKLEIWDDAAWSGSCERWLEDIDADGASVEVGAVEGRDGLFGRRIVLERDEPETTRTAGVAVADHDGFGDLAVGTERGVQAVVVRIPAQTSNKQFLRHISRFLPEHRRSRACPFRES